MQFSKQLLLLAASLSLFGCATTMSERASHVQIISADEATQGVEILDQVLTAAGC